MYMQNVGKTLKRMRKGTTRYWISNGVVSIVISILNVTHALSIGFSEVVGYSLECATHFVVPIWYPGYESEMGHILY